MDRSVELLRKDFAAEVTPSSTARRVARFVISTGNPDRDGDVVDQSGWDLTSYKRNPVVLWAHDYDALPVGRCINLAVETGRLIADVLFAEHAFAETVWNLVQGKFLNAVSVGFRAIEAQPNMQRGGIDFTRQELLEFSIVPVPANSECLRVAAARGVDLRVVREWAQRTLRELPADAGGVLDVDDDDDLSIDIEDDGVLDIIGPTRSMNPATLAGLTLDVEPAQLRHAIAETVARTLRAAVRDETATAIRRMRGRLD